MEDTVPILTQAVGGLALTVKNQNFTHITAYIGQYDGNPLKFKEWIRTMDKYNRLNGHSDIDKIKLAHMTSRGAVSDFIMRWQDENMNNMTWNNLLSALTTHFSDVTDSEHARALLRNIKQRENESVTIYVERLYNLAQDAYNISSLSTAEGKGIVISQLINNFVEGLADDSIKMKIMRRNPANLEDALEIALAEQNLQRRFSNLNKKKDFTNKKYQLGQGKNNNQQVIPMEVDQMRRKQCSICFRFGHLASQCRKRQVNEVIPKDREIKLCYYCQKPGHFKRDCEAFKKTQQRSYGERRNQFNYRSRRSEN